MALECDAAGEVLQPAEPGPSEVGGDLPVGRLVSIGVNRAGDEGENLSLALGQVRHDSGTSCAILSHESPLYP